MLDRGGETVRVVVRCRPMNARERNLKCQDVVSMDSGKCLCSLANPEEANVPPKTFTFDSVYGPQSTTEQVYNDMVYPLVEGVLEGYNATIFAYGQTGCGKSFTMQGPPAPPAAVGIIPRAFDHIFEAISVVEDTKFLVVASYIEIYNEDVRDLLGIDVKKKLELKENPTSGVFIQDLSRHTVQSVEECQKLMEIGWSNRATGSTLMNADSSRSHSIFTIAIEMMNGSGGLKRGKLNLVDLAGSERQSKTGAAGERLREASKINLSLMALGNVISALVDGKAKHIPYRDSKLTRLLQDSLGGNTKTLMIACLSPADNNYDETLSTLRYANRAKNITNKPKINEDPKDAMLRQYQQEIDNLKKLLQTGGNAEPIILSRRDSGTEKIKNDYENEVIRLRAEYEREQMTKMKLQEDMEALRQRYELRMIGETSMASNTSQQQVLERLKKLQESMVGGERAGDVELKERRMRKRKAAEKRLEALARALASVSDDDGAVLRVYDDIQEEMKAKTETIRKYKQKIRGMEKEVADLQGEFERERTDYLDTIRRNERQLLLHKQIVEKMMTGLKKECNYYDVEKIKEAAFWSDEEEKWVLPDLVLARTKFPPAGIFNGVRQKIGKRRASPTEFPFLSDKDYFTSTDLEDVALTKVLVENIFPSFVHGVDCVLCEPRLLLTGHNPGIDWFPLIEKLQKQANDEVAFGNWNNLSERLSSGSSDSSIASRTQKIERGEVEDLAGNYFKPRRANELLNRAREDATRALNCVNRSKTNNSQTHGSLNALNLYSNSAESRREITGNSLNNSWSGWGGQKPPRLEALPKPKTNTLDLI